MSTISFQDYNGKLARAVQEIQKVIKGQEVSIKMILTTLIAGGHILIEDNPGSGKTITARAVAAVLNSDQNTVFRRIQFTPDLLPMDLIGSHIFNDKTHEFIFKKGPLFTNVLLADEINRASPKVQSALLEAMAEGQITVADQTHKLDDVYFVMATQNPIESEGTYPLPHAQLDRFYMKINFGYVSEEIELNIYHQYLNIQNDLGHIQPYLSLSDILNLRALSEKVYVHEEILKAVNKLIRMTRSHSSIKLGASVRAGIALVKCMRAHALINENDFVSEDDLHAVAFNVLNHRLLYKNLKEGQELLNEMILQTVNSIAHLKIK